MFITKKQFLGTAFEGIIFQKAQRVMTPARGIIFDRPDRYIVNTPVGQLEVGVGDWVVEFVPGRRYVIKDEDMPRTSHPAQKTSWWFWRR